MILAATRTTGAQARQDANRFHAKAEKKLSYEIGISNRLKK